MEPEEGQSDLCAVVLAYFCAQARVQEQPSEPESVRLSSQTSMDGCRSSRFAAHLGKISQHVHLFCINVVKAGKS